MRRSIARRRLERRSKGCDDHLPDPSPRAARRRRVDCRRARGGRPRPRAVQRAAARRAAAVGDYRMGVTTGRPAIVVAQPLVDDSGRIVRVLTATIAIDQLNRTVAGAELPRGAAATLFDRSGTILARYPDGDQWGGKKVADGMPLAQLAAGAREVTRESVGVDGVRRFFVIVPLPTSPPSSRAMCSSASRSRR